jgi:hypothetical protein
VGHLQIIRTAALASACLVALSLAACNKGGPAQGATQNGAYVASNATNAAQPGSDQSQSASDQSLPPSNEYQAVAQSAPPPLPVYDQPPIPGPGYVWTPGYWDWSTDADDYYWVPGTWVQPPQPGVLWTPGYWRYYNGHYLYSDGYWGPQVGFYGGVDYGYGYGGNGYDGGRWQGDQFYYNSQANNLGAGRIGATYNQQVARGASRVSFNGGPGGLRVAPAQTDFAAARARHVPPTSEQRNQARMASAEPQLRASVNRGAPPIAATARPTAFRADVTAARSAAAYTPPVRPSAVGAVAPRPPGVAARVSQPPARTAPAAMGAWPPERVTAAPAKRPAGQAPLARPAPQVRAQATRAPVRAPLAPTQHAPHARAAPPRPAAHAAGRKPAAARKPAVAPKPAGEPTRHG